MKKVLIQNLITVLMTMLTPELMRKFADMVLDFAEDAVQDSSNKLDDALVLPICNTIRETFNIPDDD